MGWEREKEMKISILPHEQLYKDDMVKQVTPRDLECSNLGQEQVIQVFCSTNNRGQPSEEATVKKWSESQVPELEGGHVGEGPGEGFCNDRRC